MTDWEKLKVPELKAELKHRGLPQTGLKAALVARLVADTHDVAPLEADQQAQDDDAHELNLDPGARASETPTTDTIPGEDDGPADAAEDKVEETGREDVRAETKPEENRPDVDEDRASIDKQSRKRRSRSPPPSDDLALKRARLDSEGREDTATIHSPTPPAPELDEVKPKDTRFKDLFAPPKAEVEEPHAEPPASVVVAPAVHPATTALYIRDFMRPLNPTVLKEHITSLAMASGSPLDPEIVVDFFLDPIRTHAFVVFSTTAAASRVRSELHERIWPDERTRKPLWVDFVPASKVSEWVAAEQAVQGRSSKKWEVVYGEDDDGHVTATLQESGLTPAQSRKPPAPQGAPLGPRGEVVPRRPPDDNAIATLARPVLYYTPASKDLANRRLDSFDDATARGYSSHRADADIHRYTFEDGDVLVDRGPEIFPGIRPPGRNRGGYRSDRYDGRPRNDLRNRDWREQRDSRDYRERERRW